MVEYNTNSYYAVVWATTLESKEELVIDGELVCKDTCLPKDPRMLYGNNPNDIARIRKTFLHERVEYDVNTCKQSVVNWTEVDEYELLRDSRIIVWEGKDELYLPYDDYRIISQDDFDIIAEISEVDKIKPVEMNGNSNEDKELWVDHKVPERKVNNKILDVIKSNEDIEYYEEEYGTKINGRDRSVDVSEVQYDNKKVKRARKSWKEKGKLAYQWMVN